jgi:hypothetical protein
MEFGVWYSISMSGFMSGKPAQKPPQPYLSPEDEVLTAVDPEGENWSCVATCLMWSWMQVQYISLSRDIVIGCGFILDFVKK